jgi:hypothetical protein
LEKLEIYPTEVTQLFIELKKRGLPVSDIPVRYEDADRMLAELCGSVKKVTT